MSTTRVCALTVVVLGFAAACRSGGVPTQEMSPAPASSSATTPAAASSGPIPAGSAFAKIKVGMPSDEVFATIGQPTSQNQYQTGKAWIPFHFGGDNSRTDAHYKGVGIIVFSQKNAFSTSMEVLEIHYNPAEPGFAKK